MHTSSTPESQNVDYASTQETTKDRTALREDVLRIWGQKAHTWSSPLLASPTRLVKLTGGPGPRFISQFSSRPQDLVSCNRAFLAWCARPASASRTEWTNTKRKIVYRPGRAFGRSLSDLSAVLSPRASVCRVALQTNCLQSEEDRKVAA